MYQGNRDPGRQLEQDPCDAEEEGPRPSGGCLPELEDVNEILKTKG